MTNSYTNDLSDEDPNAKVEDPHEYILAGLVSWGIGCAKPNYAGIYTNVGFFKKWIDKNIKYN